MTQEKPKNLLEIITKMAFIFGGLLQLSYVFGNLMMAGEHYSKEMFLGISALRDWLPGIVAVAFLFGWLIASIALEKTKIAQVKQDFQLRDFLNFEFFKIALLCFGPFFIYILCALALRNKNEMLEDAIQICMSSHISSFLLRLSVFSYRKVLIGDR